MERRKKESVSVKVTPVVRCASSQIIRSNSLPTLFCALETTSMDW